VDYIPFSLSGAQKILMKLLYVAVVAIKY